MKLVKQDILVYQVGQKQKIYEVDLCEVGPDRFVVNFRYGRRGAQLKDGTKTVASVSQAEAEKTYQKLVDSKMRAGYVAESDLGPPQSAPVAAAPSQPAATVTPSVAPARPTPASAPAAANSQEQTILDRLHGTTSRVQPLHRRIFRRRRQNQGYVWPLNRAIWRAGELCLKAAVPRLTELLGQGDALQDYCIVWALGRCGDISTLATVNRIYRAPQTPAMVRRMAGEAMRLLLDGRELERYQEEQIALLPEDLQGLAKSGPPEAFAAELRTYLGARDHQAFEVNHQIFQVLFTVYAIDNENVRPGLLELLGTAPLRPNYFKRLRHIYKAAEYRRDAPVFGLLAYRFAKVRAMYNKSSWGTYGRLEDGRTVRIDDRELSKANSRFAYGSSTRTYLRRRVWRTLRRLGELGDSDYVKMAVGVLLPFVDEDTANRRSYSPYWALNHILYRRNPQFVPHRSRLLFRTRSGGMSAASKVRYEAFPELWDQLPQGALHLLDESRCHDVHKFAVKVVRDAVAFCEQLDNATVIMLLNAPYEVTAELGFELVLKRYNSAQPDTELLLAVASSVLDKARRQAFMWIEERQDQLLEDAAFMSELVTSKRAATRQFAREFLRRVVLPENTAQVLLGKLVAIVLDLKAGHEKQASDIGETLLRTFANQLKTLGPDIVRDLLSHPLEAVQELGGEILLNHETLALNPPEDIFVALLDSPHAAVRVVGVRLLCGLPIAQLSQRSDVLVALTTHSQAELRQGARHALGRLAKDDPDCAEDVAVDLVGALLRRKLAEGVGAHVVSVLTTVLKEQLGNIPPPVVWRLLNSKFAAAQELGGILLASHIDVDSVTVEQMARLANHEILSVRESAWQMYRASIPRLKQEMAAAVRIFDASWEDSRAFAFEFFKEGFGADEFTPEVLVGICDSTRPDVEHYGRTLITTYFKQEHGPEYMLKLSEHPSKSIQLFVTNYLQQYGADQPERLMELVPYFTTVLSQVNKGGVAKQRVFQFLDAEAQKSQQAGRVIAEILSWQSATISVDDKARALETMVKIQQTWPDVTLPITLQPVEARGAI